MIDSRFGSRSKEDKNWTRAELHAILLTATLRDHSVNSIADGANLQNMMKIDMPRD